MKNMRVPNRPAPSVEEARQKQSLLLRFQPKKKPPPRPPPPNLDKMKSKSAWTLTETNEKEPTQQPQCLIDWSPPISPNASAKRAFAPFVPNSGAGSISSSFSSSTSSLASSKKSFEYDAAFNISPWTNTNNGLRTMPTIIRPTILKKPKQILSLSRNASPVSSLSSQSTSSSPVPPLNLPPPPSPPKNMDDPEIVPFAIALYEYRTGHPDDLIFEVNDIIYLTERVNDEWYRGRVDAQEGMFPATFVDVQVPLPNQMPKPKPKLATVLYTYTPNMDGYLNLHAGSQITVLHRVDVDWCMGETNGTQGQFPINHVDKLPEGI